MTFRKSFLAAKKRASKFVSTINLMNTTMGAGILSLPFIIRVYGLIFGVLLLAICYLMTCFTAILLLKLKNMTNYSDYSTIAVFAYGNKGAMTMKFVLALTLLGCVVSFFVIMGTSIDHLISVIEPDAKERNSHFYL